LVAQKLSLALGQQFIIENRPGAGGVIGTRAAAKAAPDGYMLVMMVSLISLPSSGYALNRDFAPVGLIASTPIVAMTHPSFPAKSLADVNLVGGHVAIGFNTIPPAIGNIEAGRLRAIAVAAPARTAALPDVPTAAESGLPGFEAVQYYGLSAPAGIPRPIVERLNRELRSMITSEEVTKRIVAEGGDPMPSTPEEYAANIEREEGKWAALIKKLGLKIE
jgi:tripartite-type tricarboxylate transporter receptor subunit TctC